MGWLKHAVSVVKKVLKSDTANAPGYGDRVYDRNGREVGRTPDHREEAIRDGRYDNIHEMDERGRTV